MGERAPKLISLLTCLSVSGERHYTLHDVFRALAGVPRRVVVYLEFESDDAFSHRLVLRRDDGEPAYESEDILVLKNLSGRIEDVVELPIGLAGMLPGSYTIEVKNCENGRGMGVRRIFLGEMA